MDEASNKRSDESWPKNAADDNAGNSPTTAEVMSGVCIVRLDIEEVRMQKSTRSGKNSKWEARYGGRGAVELPGIEGGLNGAACANRVHRGMREALQRGDPGSKLVEIWQAERRTPVGHLCHVNDVPGRDVDEDVTRSRAKMPLRAIVCEKQRSGLKVCTCIQRVP